MQQNKMAYQNLMNSSIIVEQKPSKKPNYTPSTSLKKALKTVRKFFAKSSTCRHNKLINESSSVLNTTQQSANVDAALYDTLEECVSDEECENLVNERREAALA